MDITQSDAIKIIEQKQAVENELSWIYDFWNNLKPYAYAREEDNVIIIPPNLVYKTNNTGIQLIRYIESGRKLSNLPGINAQKLEHIKQFFRDIHAVYSGKPVALQTQRYDFSFTKLPVIGEIAVTYRCTNACKFCYAGCTGLQNSIAEKYPELDTEHSKHVINIFKEQCKIPFFSFTGGEPLLRDDLEELISFAISIGLRVNLISNGTLITKNRAHALYRAGLRTAQISLESIDAKTHDYLTGTPGSFEKTIQGIEHLLSAGISVQTNTTVTACNKEIVREIPQFVKSLGINRMSMNLYIPAGTENYRDELAVSYTACAELLPTLQKAAYSAGVQFFWYSPLPLCLYNPVAHGLGNKNCAACDGLISIAPDGSILPCSSYDEPIGNILTDDFKHLWFSSKAQWFKQKEYAPEFCKTCSAFTACQAACPLYWKYNSLNEIINCRRNP
ncbi:MAG TPA: radical SAM protein [Spirochaetia bacterium]|nr:radical SAM protein [Spirochaetales bacterium]HRS65146.1 radical SAM protein [Spirochaetia bacterium]HOT58417.1 radical SAM protein [Spirochaetales bacterium]HPD80138.1 radical SAM protein [Spirochaetales bacterium]HQK33934.1 radical SAM protein [Spirochaetales bacterium]